MTLYWWMHWFWVTAQIAGCTVIGVSTPTTEILMENVTVRTMETITTSQQSFPIAKELVYSGATIATPLSKQVVPPTVAGISNQTMNSIYENVTQNLPENKTTDKPGLISKSYAIKKEILLKNLSKTIKMKSEELTKSINITREDSLAVLPLNTDNLNDKLNNMSNSKIFSGLANNANNQISKKYTEKLVVDSVSQSSTEAESSRSNRARGALFTIDLQRDQQTHQDKHFSKLSNSKDGKTMDMYSNSGTSATDIAIITLSCLATVVLLTTAGSLGFIMYRRKYLNPPQTLNSDKCSNPDSSGYIDDSTIRDNSEEMYSLDNDSFLNSLEAMTIQNYWTDTVKHTKL